MASSRGRPSGSRHKPWEDALRLVALRENDKGAKDLDGKVKSNLNMLAEKAWAMALEGDMQAITEIGNRIDGKPKTQIVGDADDGSLLVRIVHIADAA